MKGGFRTRKRGTVAGRVGLGVQLLLPHFVPLRLLLGLSFSIITGQEQDGINLFESKRMQKKAEQLVKKKKKKEEGYLHLPVVDFRPLAVFPGKDKSFS